MTKKYRFENQDRIKKGHGNRKEQRNDHGKQKREKDFNFKLACNLRSRT